ncbi:MAG: undecaprenyl-diphosphate phosphatase [Oligoflexia bacterium]|nr:undecaprenyl-diphosphate phosphatase [Oligoflexia bacterium]
MTWFQSFFLGAIQGLTEFIPISSSAHLFLVPWFLGWQDSGLTFDVALHLGTLFAVLFYYRKEWIDLTKEFFKHGFKSKMPTYLALATIPAALVGALIEKTAETVFRNPLLVAVMLGLMGVALWVVDKHSQKSKDFKHITLKDALIVGFAQCLALIPGTSRSGVTMLFGLVCGFNRAAAAKFSFMLSMPITLGACVFKLRHLSVSDVNSVFVIGVLSSMLFGFLAIGGLIRFLQKQSFKVFAVYRVVVALIVVTFIFLRSST